MIRAVRRALTWHAPLVVFAGCMLALSAALVVAWSLDDRTLVGAPIWAKPLKFAVSLTVYSATLAWLVGRLRTVERFRRAAWWTGTVITMASATEIVIIVVQAARGRRSHFNLATGLDSALYSVMGVTIAVLFGATFVVAILLARSRIADPVLTWALRLGAGVSLLGMSVGALMTRPTPSQQATIDAHRQPTLVGAHSVGVPDGGPGLPLLGWSTTGGDLRVAHFLGMHALQAIPLLAVVLGTTSIGRRLTQRGRIRVVALAAAAQAGLTGLTTWQALRGQPVVAPDAVTVAVALVLVALTVVLLVGILLTDRPVLSPSASSPSASSPSASSPSASSPSPEPSPGAHVSASVPATTSGSVSAARSSSTGSGSRAAVYFAIAGIGLVGTWFFNLRYMSGDDPGGYVSAWFANAASSSAAVDVIVTAAAACIFYIVEGRRIGMRRAWVLIPLTFVLALAFTFPLFLGLRERALARAAATP